jgi:hypothetical protein
MYAFIPNDKAIQNNHLSQKTLIEKFSPPPDSHPPFTVVNFVMQFTKKLFIPYVYPNGLLTQSRS